MTPERYGLTVPLRYSNSLELGTLTMSVTAARFIVRKSLLGSRKNWDVIDTTNNTVIEGGFFGRCAAQDAAEDLSAAHFSGRTLSVLSRQN